MLERESEEEKRMKLEQVKKDEDAARQLAMQLDEEDEKIRTNQVAADKRMARRLSRGGSIDAGEAQAPKQSRKRKASTPKSKLATWKRVFGHRPDIQSLIVKCCDACKDRCYDWIADRAEALDETALRNLIMQCEACATKLSSLDECPDGKRCSAATNGIDLIG